MSTKISLSPFDNFWWLDTEKAQRSMNFWNHLLAYFLRSKNFWKLLFHKPIVTCLEGMDWMVKDFFIRIIILIYFLLLKQLGNVTMVTIF